MGRGQWPRCAAYMESLGLEETHSHRSNGEGTELDVIVFVTVFCSHFDNQSVLESPHGQLCLLGSAIYVATLENDVDLLQTVELVAPQCSSELQDNNINEVLDGAIGCKKPAF